MNDGGNPTEQASHRLVTPPLRLHQVEERMPLTEFGSGENSIAIIGLVRHQTHIDSPHTEQRCGIDIGAVDPCREVERADRRRQPIAPLHVVAERNDHVCQRTVRRSKPITMVDRHIDDTADGAREHDRARAGALHRITGSGVVLDTPISGPVRPARDTERIEDLGVDRGSEDRILGLDRNNGGGQGGPGHEDGQNDESAHTAPPARGAWGKVCADGVVGIIRGGAGGAACVRRVRARQQRDGTSTATRPWRGSGTRGSPKRREPDRSPPA